MGGGLRVGRWVGSPAGESCWRPFLLAVPVVPKKRTWWDPLRPPPKPHTHTATSIQISMPYRESPYMVNNDVNNGELTMGSHVWVLNVGGRHHRPGTGITMSLITCFQAAVARGKSKGFQGKSPGGWTVH